MDAEVDFGGDAEGIAAFGEGVGDVDDAEHPGGHGDDFARWLAEEEHQGIVRGTEPRDEFDEGAMVGDKLPEASCGGGGGDDDVGDFEIAFAVAHVVVGADEVTDDVAGVFEDEGLGLQAVVIGEAFPHGFGTIEIAGVFGGDAAVHGAESFVVVGARGADVDGGLAEIDAGGGDFDAEVAAGDFEADFSVDGCGCGIEGGESGALLAEFAEGGGHHLRADAARAAMGCDGDGVEAGHGDAAAAPELAHGDHGEGAGEFVAEAGDAEILLADPFGVGRAALYRQLKHLRHECAGALEFGVITRDGVGKAGEGHGKLR